MPTRKGDIPIEERVNEGQCELSNFFPDEGNCAVDAHTAITRSAIRQWIYFDTRVRRGHQSTRRDISYAPSIDLPDYVISSLIEIDGRKWDYKTDVSNISGKRRVFIEKDQMIQLDIEETLKWMSIQLPSPIEEQPPRLEDFNGETEGKRRNAFSIAQSKYLERKRNHENARERYAQIVSQLKEEASMENVNNQVILQLMYERIERRVSLLPRITNTLRHLSGEE